MDLATLAEVLPLAEIGAAGLLSVGIILVLTGRLVPGSTVDRLLASRDAIIAQQDATITQQAELAATQAAQITALVEQGATAVRALEAVRAAAGEGRTP